MHIYTHTYIHILRILVSRLRSLLSSALQRHSPTEAVLQTEQEGGEEKGLQHYTSYAIYLFKSRYEYIYIYIFIIYNTISGFNCRTL